MSKSRYYPGPRLVTKTYRKIGQRSFRSKDRAMVFHLTKGNCHVRESSLKLEQSLAKWRFW